MRGMVALVCALAVTPAAAESPLDSLAKSIGLMATPAEPPDFVKATRPAEQPAAIPVFSQPEEPRSTVKSRAELKAMDADLERASRAHRAPRTPTSDKPAKTERAKMQPKSP